MTLYEILLIVYLIVAIMLIGTVLLQQGKGAEMGASFGAGGSNTVFGSSGSGNFMTRTTAVLATLFFVISLTIGSITAHRDKQGSEFENLEAPGLQIPDETVDDSTNDTVPKSQGVDSDVPVIDESGTEGPQPTEDDGTGQ